MKEESKATMPNRQIKPEKVVCFFCLQTSPPTPTDDWNMMMTMMMICLIMTFHSHSSHLWLSLLRRNIPFSLFYKWCLVLSSTFHFCHFSFCLYHSAKPSLFYYEDRVRQHGVKLRIKTANSKSLVSKMTKLNLTDLKQLWSKFTLLCDRLTAYPLEQPSQDHRTSSGMKPRPHLRRLPIALDSTSYALNTVSANNSHFPCWYNISWGTDDRR